MLIHFLALRCRNFNLVEEKQIVHLVLLTLLLWLQEGHLDYIQVLVCCWW